MKNITVEDLKTIISNALKTVIGEEDGDDMKRIFHSVKVGEDAKNHTGSVFGCEGYFCVEGSIVSSFYYDAPERHCKFMESIDLGLKEFGLFVEPINAVEFGIYEC